MREWINLVEANAMVIRRVSGDKEQIKDAYDIISEYVTFGEVTAERRAHFEKFFKELMVLIPRPDHIATLYRFLRLSDEQLAAIKGGGLTLDMREFTSWTKSLEAAKIIALKKRGEGHAVVVTARFAPREIVVDVQEFYEENHFHGEGFYEYEKYVRPEQEVIVHHHGPIRLTPQNTMLLGKPETIMPPKVGDLFFWHNGDDDGYEIEDVDHEQPYADRGLFYVTPEGHNSELARNVGEGWWESIDIEQ